MQEREKFGNNLIDGLFSNAKQKREEDITTTGSLVHDQQEKKRGKVSKVGVPLTYLIDAIGSC